MIDLTFNSSGKDFLMRKRFLAMILLLSGFFFLTSQTGGPGNPKKGKIVFEKNCSLCHGKSGAGLGPSTRMPNFSDKKFQESRATEDLFNKVTRGVEGTGMPSYEKSLSVEERWDVTSYIKSLAGK
jgi:mono/diheme cytochrome c family protein